VTAAVRGTMKGFTTSIGRGSRGAEVASVKLRDRCDDAGGGDVGFAACSLDSEAATTRR